MKTLIVLFLSLFLFLSSVSAQTNVDTLSTTDREESVSTTNVVIAPLDSIMLVQFTTVDDVRVAMYTNAVYFRKGDFIKLSWSRDIIDIVESKEMYYVKGPIEITYK